MRLILSRKGFDSGAGGMPSPVLPDGTMLSLPIPEPGNGGSVPYESLRAGSWGTYADVAKQLGARVDMLARGAHLDPDLRSGVADRLPGWRPALGQSGAAAGHLWNQGVGAGDLLLFWGLFRHTSVVGGRLRWAAGSTPFHAVFGWLRVGAVLRPPQDVAPAWLDDHPHVSHAARPRNTVYVAASGPGGAGVLDWSSTRRLTVEGGPVSTWALPQECHPDRSGVTLSYHGAPNRWREGDGLTLLDCARRGQEFVVDAAPPWLSWSQMVLDGRAA